MPRIVLAPEVLDDFDRFLGRMRQFDVTNAPARIEAIIQSIDILAHSPLLGRPAKGGKRELVIGRGARGFVALYRFVEAADTVFILAIRNQRERDYRR